MKKTSSLDPWVFWVSLLTLLYFGVIFCVVMSLSAPSGLGSAVGVTLFWGLLCLPLVGLAGLVIGTGLSILSIILTALAGLVNGLVTLLARESRNR